MVIIRTRTDEVSIQAVSPELTESALYGEVAKTTGAADGAAEAAGVAEAAGPPLAAEDAAEEAADAAADPPESWASAGAANEAPAIAATSIRPANR
jgi:hypothetical protein